MPTFDFTTLLWWGLPFAAAPVVIHLINLLRHKVVRWPTMEFLLASQRKYRTQILLKQLLLLLLRVLAIVGLVGLLAQPRWTAGFGRLLGGQQTTHVVLLDDSFSMGETLAAGTPDEAEEDLTAFVRGRRMVARLLDDLAATPGRHTITVGRCSQLAAPLETATPATEEAPSDRFDLRDELISPQNLPALRRVVDGLGISAAATGPTDALRSIPPLLNGQAAGVLWLVTDLRSRDWQTAEPMADILQPLAAAGVEIHLVDAAVGGPDTDMEPATQQPNLTVERIEMVGGVPASDVLLPWQVTLRNQGTTEVGPVPLAIREDGLERPGIQVDAIPPGDTATVRFESRFPTAGGHLVEVELPPDRLAQDNRRTAAVEVVDEADVLIIASTSGAGRESPDAFYLATALNPGGAAATGLRPRIEPPQALASLDLSQFDSIWLVDVGRLTAAQIASLETYARAGGGVVFFAGPTTSADAINQSLFRDGDGLFPAPLAGAVDLLPDPRNPEAPDVIAETHPVVAILSGRRNPFLDAVRIDRYMAIDRSYTPPADGGFRRLLSLRNRAALAVERPFGNGLGVAILTTAGPLWNNWARNNPSWVVVMLELEGQLARLRQQHTELLVGQPFDVTLEPGIDQIDVDFLLPPHGAMVRQVAAATDAGQLAARLTETDTPGGYTARWQTVNGTSREQLIAVNINPAEGSLSRLSPAELGDVLAGVPFTYDRADLLQASGDRGRGASLLRPLLLLLLGILLAEQLVSYVVSYHPVRRSSP